MSTTGAAAGAEPGMQADLAIFTRQLGAMLDANVNVLRALRIASSYTGNERLIQAAADIAARLEDGREFHQAIQPDPDLFDAFYVEMVRQGEADGLLGQALLSVADYLDRPASGTTTGAEGVPAAGLTTVVRETDPTVAAETLTTLGVGVLGGGAVLALAALGVLPKRWRAPLATLWAGGCLLAGGQKLRPGREPGAVPAPVSPGGGAPALPPKSRERKVAETEAVVRNALDEQQLEEEEASFRRAPLQPELPAPAGLNGAALDLEAEPLDLSEDPPHFSF